MDKKYLYKQLIILIGFISFYILIIENQFENFEWWQLAIYLTVMLLIIFYLVREKNK